MADVYTQTSIMFLVGDVLWRRKMYLFLKLVAFGIIRLSPASQFCGEFEYVYPKCLRNGEFVGVLKAPASHYSREFESYLWYFAV